jgi:hypothetical protein
MLETETRVIRHAIPILKTKFPSTWGRYTKENLEARYREAIRKQRIVKAMAARLLQRTPLGMYAGITEPPRGYLPGMSPPRTGNEK